MKVGIVRFPGSNRDREALHAVQDAGHDASLIWHRSTDLEGADLLILPGGFSYGDYLRPGAIARFSPVMQAVTKHAAAGRPVLGICNGFQILCEANLLPGQLVRNASLAFVSKMVSVRVESDATPFTAGYRVGQELRLPVAHGDGRYVADDPTLDRLERDGRVVFRYVPQSPNGAMHDIAGITNEGHNVVGLMPHPECAVDALTGSADGAAMFAPAALAAAL
ncbi:MAG: phosphoribosylformylglycinamidine synthase I [Gemmatimonadetes bacterium GWC2_71_10]|nr:MAG: phosphoribosylformylglycinamidine synthase I [Gemmatimonadetes bacterium GWC2_71_10]